MASFEINRTKYNVVMLLLISLKFCENTILLTTNSNTLNISHPKLDLLKLKSNMTNARKNHSKYGLDDLTRQPPQSLYTNPTKLHLKDNNKETKTVYLDNVSILHKEKRDKESKKSKVQTNTKKNFTSKRQSDKMLDSKILWIKTTDIMKTTTKNLNDNNKNINTNPLEKTNQLKLSQNEENYELSSEENTKQETKDYVTFNESIEYTLEDVSHEQQMSLHTNISTTIAKNISILKHKDNASEKVTFGTPFEDKDTFENFYNIRDPKQGINSETSAQVLPRHIIKTRSIGTTKSNEVIHYWQDDIKPNPYKSYMLLLSHWTKRKDEKFVEPQYPPEKYSDWFWNNKQVNVKNKMVPVYHLNFELENNKLTESDDFSPLLLSDFYRPLPVHTENKLKRNNNRTPVNNRFSMQSSEKEDSLWDWMLRDNHKIMLLK